MQMIIGPVKEVLRDPLMNNLSHSIGGEKWVYRPCISGLSQDSRADFPIARLAIECSTKDSCLNYLPGAFLFRSVWAI
jgi:hypothetical protein